jgi:hypothetical protein
MRMTKLITALMDKVCSKLELERLLYPECAPGSRDRHVRKLIEILRQDKKIPIAATSDQKGYWIATNYKRDYEGANHCRNELKKRAREMLLSAEALDIFCEEAEKCQKN